MTIYKCDKCLREVSKGQLSTVASSGSHLISARELCEYCIDRLLRWLEPDAKEAPRAATELCGARKN
jgi:DNA-directed RNA polymerase subunit RPC12/RpoP